jgi:hypothetical protein
MWEPADKNGIPNEGDQVHARRAIAQLQMELSAAMDLLPAAEPYVREILRAIEGRWAWLSPIRRIPFEIFSVIFIMAAEKDGRSPAFIAGVCRFWRDVVLATPQAWAFLDLRSNPPPRIASIFFQRSGRCPIHTTIISAKYLTVGSGISHRIECMVIAIASKHLVLEDYPNLTRLTISDHLLYIPLDYLDRTRFPKLRYFDGAFAKPEDLQEVDVGPRFPRVEKLIVTTDSEGAWVDAIQACARTLTGLRINVGVKAGSDPSPSVDLSRLKHLAIERKWDRRHRWFFSATTPSLETYDIDFEANLFGVQVDVDTVTQLQCSDADVIDLREYTSLHQLRVIGFQHEAVKIIDKLRQDPGLCPTLEHVIASWNEQGQRKATQDLVERNRTTGVELKVLFATDQNWSWCGEIRSSVSPRCKQS